MDTDNGCFTLLACIASLQRSLEVTLKTQTADSLTALDCQTTSGILALFNAGTWHVVRCTGHGWKTVPLCGPRKPVLYTNVMQTHSRHKDGHSGASYKGSALHCGRTNESNLGRGGGEGRVMEVSEVLQSRGK